MFGVLYEARKRMCGGHIQSLVFLSACNPLSSDNHFVRSALCTCSRVGRRVSTKKIVACRYIAVILQTTITPSPNVRTYSVLGHFPS
jgi:hypothetical protein